MKTTILFIHRSESWYLYYAVKQARKWNPHAHIAVISDHPQPSLRGLAEVYAIQQFWPPAADFEKIYHHMSCNSVQFELFCFQRWFVMAEFIRQHRPERVVHLDSDILIYDELSTDFGRMEQHDLALVGFQGPFSLFIPRPALVAEFCRHITHLFTHEVADLEKMYRQWAASNPYTAISDMHALHTFVAKYQLRSLDLAIPHDSAVYDNIVHESDGYQLAIGCKALEWKNGQPFGRRLSDSASIRFKSLHCQGPSKSQILNFFTAKDLRHLLWRLRQKLRS